MNEVLEKNKLRSFAHVFSTASFKKILQSEETDFFFRTVEKHVENTSGKSVEGAVKDMYFMLKNSYRNEYYFKNTLFNQLVKHYGLENSVVLDEFKIGGSIADFVFLNGEACVYEIKTAFDDLSKLKKQVADYMRFADKVYIVTSPNHKIQALKLLRDSKAGIIILDNDNCLQEAKKAEKEPGSLRHDAVFKTLRKPEYTSLIADHFGDLPNVPNTLIYKACLDLSKKIPIEDFQKKAIDLLKSRQIAHTDLLQSAKVPHELKHICYTLNLNQGQYNQLFTLLKQPV